MVISLDNAVWQECVERCINIPESQKVSGGPSRRFFEDNPVYMAIYSKRPEVETLRLLRYVEIKSWGPKKPDLELSIQLYKEDSGPRLSVAVMKNGFSKLQLTMYGLLEYQQMEDFLNPYMAELQRYGGMKGEALTADVLRRLAKAYFDILEKAKTVLVPIERKAPPPDDGIKYIG